MSKDKGLQTRHSKLKHQKLKTNMKKILFSLILMLATIQLFAQDNGVEMADKLRSDGKIYVVVACIVIILLGLLAYLFSIDKRLKKIEKENSPKN